MAIKPRYIGILTDQYIEYQRNFVDTISRTMDASGYGTLCITSQNLELLENPSPDQLAHAVFPPASNSQLSGLICLSGTLAHNFDLLRLDAFLQKFDIPTVSLGFELPSFPSVIVDDQAGMSQLMEHLLADGRRKRFVFVRGYSGDPYSTERESIFRQCLANRNIDITESCFLEGNYDQYQSYVAVSSFLDVNDDVDAIVAANDVMALSAARAVAATGRSIPNDVIVTGFDDTAEATQHSPAITTVRQPTIKMAENSAKLLLALIQADSLKDTSTIQAANQVTSVKSELVIRSSSRPLYTDDKDTNPISTINTGSVDTDWLEVAMSGLRKPENICLNTIREATSDTITYNNTSLETCFAQIIQEKIQVEDVHWWNNLCFQVELYCTNTMLLNGKSKMNSSIVAPLSSMREKLWSISLDQSFVIQKLQAERANLQLQISSCTSFSDITNAMDRWLDSVQAKRFYLIRYEKPQTIPCDQAVLMHVYKSGLASEPCDTKFASKNVLPDSLSDELTDGQLVLSPVYADSNQFGYILIDPSGIDLVQIDNTAQCIGNAMRNQHLIKTLENQTKNLQSANTELEELANYDALTGLSNRLQFQRFLNEKCESSILNQSVFSLLFMDLDGFKLINDTLGHDAGDELLKLVAERLTTLNSVNKWKSALISRLGGDEFTFVLDTVSNASDVTEFADAVLELMTKEYSLENQMVRISASIGCTVFPKDGQDADTLLRHADTAMYHAKEQGKNRIVFFSSEIGNKSVRNHELDQSMRRAINNGEIAVLYQPRFDIDSESIQCIETERCWMIKSETNSQTPTSAEELEAVAERSGFIAELDLFTLESACSQAGEWVLAGYPTQISVEISITLLRRKEFIYTLVDLLNRHNIDPALLELQMSESSFLKSDDHSLGKLKQLSVLGVKMSIGSFGRHHVAIDLLERIPIDNLKIDDSVVAAISKSEVSELSSIVRLGESLNASIVAVGVETDDQLNILKKSGCDYICGTLLSPAHSEQSIKACIVRDKTQSLPPAAA